MLLSAQASGFGYVHALGSSCARVRAKRVPGPTDFEMTNDDDVEKCEEFIAYLEEAIGVLKVIHRSRPKQKRIDFNGGAEGQEGAATKPKKEVKA